MAFVMWSWQPWMFSTDKQMLRRKLLQYKIVTMVAALCPRIFFTEEPAARRLQSFLAPSPLPARCLPTVRSCWTVPPTTPSLLTLATATRNARQHAVLALPCLSCHDSWVHAPWWCLRRRCPPPRGCRPITAQDAVVREVEVQNGSWRDKTGMTRLTAFKFWNSAYFEHKAPPDAPMALSWAERGAQWQPRTPLDKKWRCNKYEGRWDETGMTPWQPSDFETVLISNTKHPLMPQWHCRGQSEERNDHRWWWHWRCNTRWLTRERFY